MGWDGEWLRRGRAGTGRGERLHGEWVLDEQPLRQHGGVEPAHEHAAAPTLGRARAAVAARARRAGWPHRAS